MKITFAFVAGATSIILLEASFVAGIYATTKINAAKNQKLDDLKETDIQNIIAEVLNSYRKK